mgnify:CR=1 FL=1
MEKGSDRRLSLKNDHSPAGEIRSRIVMLEFKPITAADGAWARPLLLKADCISCGYTFANLFVWSPVYHTDLARFQDFVIARCFDHPNTPDSPYLYLFPEGDGDKRAAIREIVQDAAVHGKMPRLYSLSQRDKAWLEEQFPGIFAFTSCRGTFDYIYSSEELQNLPGKKFQKKRNHVSRFLREHPDFVFEPITPENLEEVRAFNNAWSQLYGNSQDTGIQTEHLAVEMGLKHFFELELSGGLIRADGKIIGKIRRTGTTKNKLRSGAAHGQIIPIRRWKLPESWNESTIAVISDKAFRKSPRCIWALPRSKWKSAA